MQIINKILYLKKVYIFFISFVLFLIIFSTSFLYANNFRVADIDISSKPSVVMIGREGGFVPFEKELAISLIAQPIHLGGRTLSVDTAVTTVLAQALPKKKN